jgi:Mrr N-terminal domain
VIFQINPRKIWKSPMPVIRVSEEVIEILKKFAIPLKDTPDSVLRRILQEYIRIKNGKNDELSNSSSLPKKRTPLGKSKQRYAQWIIASLKSQGGRARAKEVIDNIEKLFGNEFSEEEREPLKSGKPRWIKNINSARVEMVKQGFLKKTRYGIWEIT